MLISVLMAASSNSEVSTPWWVYFIYMLAGSLAWKISQKRRAQKSLHEDDEDDDHDQCDDDGDDDDARYYGMGDSRWNAGMPRGHYLRRRVRGPRHPVLLVVGMVVAALAACILIVVIAQKMGYVK